MAPRFVVSTDEFCTRFGCTVLATLPDEWFKEVVMLRDYDERLIRIRNFFYTQKHAMVNAVELQEDSLYSLSSNFKSVNSSFDTVWFKKSIDTWNEESPVDRYVKGWTLLHLGEFDRALDILGRKPNISPSRVCIYAHFDRLKNPNAKQLMSEEMLRNENGHGYDNENDPPNCWAIANFVLFVPSNQFTIDLLTYQASHYEVPQVLYMCAIALLAKYGGPYYSIYHPNEDEGDTIFPMTVSDARLAFNYLARASRYSKKAQNMYNGLFDMLTEPNLLSIKFEDCERLLEEKAERLLLLQKEEEDTE